MSNYWTVSAMMDWADTGSAGPMLVVLGLLTIALVVVLVLAVNAMYPSRGQGDRAPTGQHGAPRSAAEDELELRYTRGEIDAESLARHRAVLRRE